MRRILSICITLILFFSVIPLNGNYPTIAKAKQKGNIPATFIAKRLHAAGYDRDGKPIDPDPSNPAKAISNGRFFPWEFTRGSSWGRKEIKMPGSPVFWFEIYLTIQADGGKSKPENRWVGVIDSTGLLWMDPDGNFHDSNYDKLADPFHPAYVPGRCENNPRAQIDPLSNTQGPYVLDISNPEYREDIYFYDKLITGRGWKIGWIDMVDYLAASTAGPDGIISDGIVKIGDWDLDLPLIKFINNGDEEDIGGIIVPISDPTEEWHAENIEANDHYDLGEFMYLLGSGHNQTPTTDMAVLTQRNTVQIGDTRQSVVSLTDNATVFTYTPGTTVQPGDRDIGIKLIPYVDNGNPVPEAGEEWHTGTKMGDSFKLGDNVYLKMNSVSQNFVQLGDIRLSNVNTRRDKNGIKLAGIYTGDMIVFSEVLQANCDGTGRYDLSVETDLWLSTNPSITTAKIVSSNGDIPAQTQHIQKSTILDPSGKEFIVPATTFHDITPLYRGYIGVEIFADNGIDANIAANLPGDVLLEQNASDDYRTGRTGEEFLGAVNGNLSFDFGQPLIHFSTNQYMHVLNPPTVPPAPGEHYAPPFGCGISMYEKEVPFTATPVEVPWDGLKVQENDIRLTTVTVDKAGQRVTYPSRSRVVPGDLDVGFNLYSIPTDISFLDDTAYENAEQYDEGELIYQSSDSLVNNGDIRMTEVVISGKTYPCNTRVDESDYWIRETPIHMITMGKSGDGKALDMVIMPGKLDLEINLDKNFKVEQTTTINAKLNTPLKKGEKVHLVIKEPEISGFGGVPAPEASYVETVLAHEWLPLAPEGEDEWEYRLGQPFDPRRTEYSYNYPLYTNPPINGVGSGTPGAPGSGLWSDPTTYARVNAWSYQKAQWAWTPTAGPARGPYQFDIATGSNPFIFKFLGMGYKRIFVHTTPIISLANGTTPIGSAPVPYYQVDGYQGAYMATGQAVASVQNPSGSASPYPALVAYGDGCYANSFYYYPAAISAARFTESETYDGSGLTDPLDSYYGYRGRGELGYGYNYLSYNYGMYGPCAPWYGPGAYSFADFKGFYDPAMQPLTTGIWAYLDESVSPRRYVITWKLNLSYANNIFYPYNYVRPEMIGQYPTYQVQMILYEGGTFQYNYNFGNRVWMTNSSYNYPYTPAVGYYTGKRSGGQALTYPHHLNKDLNQAPSTRFSFYQPPGKVDAHDPWKMYTDYRVLSDENKEVNFQYTPYRGTCKEDGTRERLEVLAFYDKGGRRTPIQKDPLKDVNFDDYDLPVGVAGLGTTASPKQYVYVDMDRSGMVSPGDIRLTNVAYAIGVDVANYPIGSVVLVTDLDSVTVPYSVPTDVTNSGNAGQWKAFNPSNARLGGAVYVAGSEVRLLVYVDMNENGIADVPDIRLVGFRGYAQGSVVGSQDWEVYDPQTGAQKNTPLFPQRAPIGVNKKKYVYYDRDYSQTLSRFDVRLTSVDSYLDGTKVGTGDLDVGTPYKATNIPVGIHDPVPSQLYNDAADFHFNCYAHMGDVNNSIVMEGDLRLTDCYIMNGTLVQQIYKRGTMVGSGDLDLISPNNSFDYAYQPELLVWYNQFGSGIYADVNRMLYTAANNNGYPSNPPGMTRPDTRDIRLVKNRFFKPVYGYSWYYDQFGSREWDAGKAVIPASWAYSYPYPYWYQNTFDNCYIQDGGTGAYCMMYPWAPTTYAGAMVNESSFYRTKYVSITINNTAYINSLPISNAVKVGDTRMMEIGSLQQGTYVEIDSIDRQSNFMFDPYWSLHPWTKLELDQNPFKAINPVPAVLPMPTLPTSIQNQYDCYAWFKYDIAPEEFDLTTETSCIPLNPQRFPNVSIRIKDHDNPNDVNDPANVVVSGHPDEPMVMNFNAHGGGIKFFFTAVAQPPSYQKYIGQYNEDDTVVFWYWYDNVPYGVLDTNDYLKNTYDIIKGGGFKPLGSDPNANPSNSPFPNPTYWMLAPPFPARIWDIDCSFNQTVCSIAGDQPGFPKLGEVNNRFYYFAFDMGDVNGRTIWNMGDQIINQTNQAPSFDGVTVDPQIIYCTSRGDQSTTNYCAPKSYGTVWTYGVPVSGTSWTNDDEGGRLLVPVKPFKTDTPVTIRIYSARVLYDYNSRYPHGPAFVHDTGAGIDYVGLLDLKVLEPDPKLNFGEFEMIDHSLQNSKINYTSGADALSPMIYPTPMLHADYDPILKDFNKDIRAYPGGNTHSGRIPKDQYYSGFNAYPSLWPNMYNKLGTEMFPFTDYGISFILHDGYDNRIYWDPNVLRPDLNIKSIIVEGPFMTPRIFERYGGSGALTQSYRTNYANGLPLQYDFSGKITIDVSNYTLYSSPNPPDLSQVASPWSTDAFRYNSLNARLLENKKMWYYGRFKTISQYMWDNGNSNPPGNTPSQQLQTVHFIDEIIPISNGKLKITVQLYDGTIKKYEDCCNEIFDNLPVNGLEVTADVSSITVDTDSKVQVKVNEYDTKSLKPADHTIPCNDALVLMWQDRGIKDQSGKVKGAGDGWITVPPRSSSYSSSGSQLNKQFDINNDGKVSYQDYETEIIGTYDIASNTWKAGLIDARTFQRNEGSYVFDLSAENGALVDTVGADFGGPVSLKNVPDHVIDDYEVLPIYITAFKYGDDDNDRSFSPYYSLAKPYEFSHEVYASGLKPIDVMPKNDWVVSYNPEPLTAGCVPELLQAGTPLTFNLLDADGNPVDLSKGIKDPSGVDLVDDINIWNVLIKDPHPDNRTFYGPMAKLPQYYWLRTDLHNDDGTIINNYRQFSIARNPFLPIITDFTAKKEGKYVFKGFCTNDEGTMKVYIDSPDRKHRGTVDVTVKSPRTAYQIIDFGLALETNVYQQVPAGESAGKDTDYILTSHNFGNNWEGTYWIYPYAFDASGSPITGSVSIDCQTDSTSLTRMTPYSTKPYNFNFYSLGYSLNSLPEINRTVLTPSNLSGRYTNRGWRQDEKNPNYVMGVNFGGFPLWNKNWTTNYQRLGSYTYYNTTNWRWEDGTYELLPVFDVPPANNVKGMGRGAIYNSPKKGGYLFPDWNGANEYLDWRDSILVTEPGKQFFIYAANDASDYGVLVGKNPYSNAVFGDVVGGLRNYRNITTYPDQVRYRYSQYQSDTIGYSNGDGTYRLDWDAFGTWDGKALHPKAKVMNETLGTEFGKNLLNPDNYDLLYGKPNHLRIIFSPNSSPNYPILPYRRVWIASILGGTNLDNKEAVAENYVGARTEISGGATTMSVDGTTEAQIRVTPTGTWNDLAQIVYIGTDFNLNERVAPHMADFDVIKNITVSVKTSSKVYANKPATLLIYVVEQGTQKPVQGASVVAKGPGVNANGKTDKDGLVRLEVTPNAKGMIDISVNHPDLGEAFTEVSIFEEGAPQTFDIMMQSSTTLTNKDKVTLSGTTNVGCTITINNEIVPLNNEGRFIWEVTLNEGENVFVIEATDPSGAKVRKVMTIIRDTIGPIIELAKHEIFTDKREVEINGFLNEDGTVKVNEKEAIIDGRNWKALIPVTYGKNVVKIVANDTLGNESIKNIDIEVYKKMEVKLSIGKKNVWINGLEQENLLAVAPYIKKGTTFVPIRLISESFGAKVEWLPQVKGIVIEFMDKKIEMQIGSRTAMVNGKTTSIDNPPENTLGVTFVPLRFIADAMGAKTQWIPSSRDIIITIFAY
jgi:hypothetical protein